MSGSGSCGCAHAGESGGGSCNGGNAIEAGATVNEIVLRHPETLPVLQSFGIDACCGGALTLGEAARRHGHDVSTLREALDAARAAAGKGAG